MPQHTPALVPGQELDLAVTGLITDGRGLARHQGLAVFVNGALPGQTVRARIAAVKRSLAEADTIQVVIEAPSARPAPCPHAEECGGCSLQSMPYALQVEWKSRFVADALSRIGKLAEPPLLSALPSPAEWGYRNKMEFAFGRDDNNPDVPALGLRRRASHGIVPVTDCRLQSPLTMRLVAAARAVVSQSGLSAWTEKENGGLWRFLIIREPTVGGCLVEVIVGPHPEAIRHGQALADALAASCPEMTGFILSERVSTADVAYGERRLWKRGDTKLEEGVNEVRFALGAGAFFQVNTAAAALLYDEAARFAVRGSTHSVWDLYCGVGSIGLYLGTRMPIRHLVGVDTSSQAINLARDNARVLLPDLDSFWHAGDVARLIPGIIQKNQRPDLIIVDPPRSGLDARLVHSLVRVHPERILYVSCDPATLARDIARFNGYTLEAARPVDLFPHTPHVETVCLLTAH